MVLFVVLLMRPVVVRRCGLSLMGVIERPISLPLHCRNHKVRLQTPATNGQTTTCVGTHCVGPLTGFAAWYCKRCGAETVEVLPTALPGLRAAIAGQPHPRRLRSLSASRSDPRSHWYSQRKKAKRTVASCSTVQGQLTSRRAQPPGPFREGQPRRSRITPKYVPGMVAVYAFVAPDCRSAVDAAVQLAGGSSGQR